LWELGEYLKYGTFRIPGRPNQDMGQRIWDVLGNMGRLATLSGVERIIPPQYKGTGILPLEFFGNITLKFMDFGAFSKLSRA